MYSVNKTIIIMAKEKTREKQENAKDTIYTIKTSVTLISIVYCSFESSYGQNIV